MKKLLKMFFYIIVGLIVLMYIIKIYSENKELKIVRDFLKIESSVKIEVLKRGGSKEPPKLFMVLKLDREIPKQILERDFVTDNKNLILSDKYFNLNKPYFYKQEDCFDKGILKREVAVQNKTVFYKVYFTN